MDVAKLIWATPGADALIGHMARVSNPNNQDNPDVAGLIRYMIRNQHWSPFEMASMCVEINTTRDIGRQILRHRSFCFQEFSQRYASTDTLKMALSRECRMQDSVNRQNSLPADDTALVDWWERAQQRARLSAGDMYREALARGIAKEQARALLPEGLTPTRMYMAGTLRSWLHYIQLRTDLSTQKEHRDIAEQCRMLLWQAAPIVAEAAL